MLDPRRPSSALFLLVAVAGIVACGADLTVPADARITCATDHGCPAGWVCASRVGRCVAADGEDREAPTVEPGAVVAPEIVSLEGVVTATFVVSEPLGARPAVALDLEGEGKGEGEGGDEGAMSFSQIEADGLSYRFGYTPAGDEPEGVPVSVVVSLVDRAGNSADGVALGSVRFDFTRPEITVVTASQRRLAAGKRAVVRVTADEELAGPPVVYLDTEDGRAFEPDDDGSGPGYAYAHDVVEQDGVGPHDVTVVAVDEAGNERTLAEPGLLSFDFEAPRVEGEVTATREFAAPGDAISVSFWVSEALAGPSAVTLVAGEEERPFSSVDVAGLLVTAAHVVGAEDEGVWDVRLDLEDVAGNTTARTPDVRFVLDGTAPEILDGRLWTDPEVLDVSGSPVLVVGDGGVLRASFSVRDERALAADPPTVVLEAAGWPVTLAPDRWERGEEGLWEAELSVALDAAEHLAAGGAAWPVRVAVADAAGNVGTVSALADAQVRVDFSPPEAQCVASRAIAKEGDMIQVDAHFAEPVRPGSVALDCGERAGGGDLPCAQSPILPERPADGGPPDPRHFVFRHTLPDAGGTPWWYRVRAEDLVGYEGENGRVCEGEVPVDRVQIGVRSVGDGVSASLDGVGTGTFVTRGSDVAIRFSLDDAPVPGSLRVRVGQVELEEPVEIDEDGLVFEYAWTVPPGAPDDDHEKLAPVSVEVADLAGHITTETLGTLRRDFVAPSLAGAYFTLSVDDEPLGGGPAPSLDRARIGPTEVYAAAGVRVGVRFTLSEPALASEGRPVPIRLLRAGDLVAELAHDELQTEFEATLLHPLDPDRPEGTALIEADVSDRAGSAARLGLGTIHFDAGRPGDLSDRAQAAVQYYRAPTGAAETGGAAVTELRACPAADAGPSPWEWCPEPDVPRPFEPDALVTVSATRVEEDEDDGERRLVCGGRVLIRDVAGEAGGLATGVPGDWPGVCVLQTDRAGNSSDPRLVERVEWLATLAGKRRGSVLENPHRLQRVFSFSPATLRQPMQ